MDPAEKIRTLEQMDAWVASQKAANQRIGFTCGAFDLLHAGHAHYLAAAKQFCDSLLVAVNSDNSVRRYKHPLRPIHPEDQRMYLVAGLEAVDAVTRMDDDRPLALLLRWKPGVYIKGGDYDAESLRSADAVRAYGGEVRLIPQEFRLSSSALLEKIAGVLNHAQPEEPAARASRGLVLLDRDGTLIRDVPFLRDPDRVELLPGVVEGLRELDGAGFRLAIVSNQQGIGLGYLTTADFIAVNQRLFSQLGRQGVRISRVYFCPHSLADDCECRKPGSGMIRRAMRDFGEPPERTFVIGDSEADLAAAGEAGCAAFRTDGADFAAVAAKVLAV
jgi:rfaE bifunctional protein nucleotidyltransferase chain/domain